MSRLGRQRRPTFDEFCAFVCLWVSERRERFTSPEDEWPHLVFFLGSTDHPRVLVREFETLEDDEKHYLSKATFPGAIFEFEADLAALAVNAWMSVGDNPASEDDDRTESICLQIFGLHRNEVWMARIIRSAAAPPTLGEWHVHGLGAGPLVDDMGLAVNAVGRLKASRAPRWRGRRRKR